MMDDALPSFDLTPVDHDPFAAPAAAAAPTTEDDALYTPLTVPVGKMPSPKPPVSSNDASVINYAAALDNHGATASYLPPDENYDPRTPSADASPYFDYAREGDNPMLSRIGSGLEGYGVHALSGLVNMPQQAADAMTGINAGQAAMQGAELGTPAYQQAQTTAEQGAGGMLGTAGAMIDSGIPMAEEGALGVAGGRLGGETEAQRIARVAGHWLDQTGGDPAQAVQAYRTFARQYDIAPSRSAPVISHLDSMVAPQAPATWSSDAQYLLGSLKDDHLFSSDDPFHQGVAAQLGALRSSSPFDPFPITTTDPDKAGLLASYQRWALNRNSGVRGTRLSDFPDTPITPEEQAAYAARGTQEPPAPPTWNPNAAQYLTAERDHLVSLGQTWRATDYDDILAAGPNGGASVPLRDPRNRNVFATAMDNHTYTGASDAAAAPWFVRGTAANADPLQPHLDAAGMDRGAFLQQMFGKGGASAVVEPYGDTVALHAPVTNDAGANVGVMTRTFPGDGTVDHTYFKVEDGAQDSGIGKDMLARQIPLYQKMGLNAVTVHANIDVGGYAWSKYGFVPDQASWNTLRSKTKLQTNLGKVADQLSPETLADVQATLKNRDPTAIRRLADDRTPVVPPSPLPLAGKAPTPQQPTTLGKHLLLGSNWTGKMDLKDPATMSRFNSYVGKPVLP